MARSTQARMFSLIGQWQDSGLTQKNFCEKKDITYARFHYWYKKFRDVDPPGDIVPSFVPVNISQDMGSSFCTVRLPGGAEIDFHVPVPPAYLNQLSK
jgi:hypothetical protein